MENGDPHWDAADESFVIHRREREREREREKRKKRGCGSVVCD
jgi:hypothetical protein